MDPFTIGTILGGAQVGLKLLGIADQRKALGRAQAEASYMAALQSRQVEDQAALRTLELKRREQQILGRIRVSAAAQGTDVPSLSSLIETAGAETGLNLSLNQQNTTNALYRIQTGLRAQLSQLQPGNQFLQLLTAGLEGVNTGINSATSVLALNKGIA